MSALPSLTALQALDRIERLGSVQAAAASLNLTPSAVSHRLRGLDAALGFPVTAAEGRGLALTPRARAFMSEARPALAALEGAAARAGAEVAAVGPLLIAAPPGFAATWLAPRLADLRRTLPRAKITLATGPAPDADVEILFETTPPRGATRLMRPDFFPVASPGVATQGAGLRTAAGLKRRTLLHLFDRRDWRRWGEAAGAAPGFVDKAAEDGRELMFRDANLLIAAAVAGQGVALGDPITCDGALKEGRLIAPFAAATPSERTYWLRLSPGATHAAAACATWLRSTLGVT